MTGPGEDGARRDPEPWQKAPVDVAPEDTPEHHEKDGNKDEQRDEPLNVSAPAHALLERVARPKAEDERQRGQPSNQGIAKMPATTSSKTNDTARAMK